MLNKSKKYDAIIIGQGLAGSILAWQLIQAGKSVLVIDNAHYQSSSKVAAGMINPITGHRLNLTKDFAEYMEYAKPFYESLEAFFGEPFLFDVPQLRLIKNPGQASYLEKRLEEPEYKDYLAEANAVDSGFTDSSHGVVKVLNSYRVDAKKLLAKLAEFLDESNALMSQLVDYSTITTNADGIHVGEFSAKKLIFCEGFQAIHNPWLKDLPFKVAKGEVLTVKANPCPKQMMNWGNWLLPISSDLSYLGSSYAWNDTSCETSADTANSLLDSLNTHTEITASVVEHKAGIRPSTQDRQFFVGKLKELQHAYCFNGFGSKGCLTIPYFANVMCEQLKSNNPFSSISSKLDSLAPELIDK